MESARNSYKNTLPKENYCWLKPVIVLYIIKKLLQDVYPENIRPHIEIKSACRYYCSCERTFSTASIWSV